VKNDIIFAISLHAAVQDKDRAYMEKLPNAMYEGTDRALVEILEKNIETGNFEVVDAKFSMLYVYAIPPVLLPKLAVDYWVRAPDGKPDSGKWTRVENMLGRVEDTR